MVGGRIFDLAPDHLQRVTHTVLSMARRPEVMLEAEAALRESAGLRRIADLLDLPEDVLLVYQRDDRPWTYQDRDPEVTAELEQAYADAAASIDPAAYGLPDGYTIGYGHD
jgi:hypothetical protein